MDFLPQIPRISISPPPPEDPQIEVSSVFPVTSCEDDGFRPRHLTPPPTTTNFKRPLSPPSPLGESPKGIESQRFQALLRATRERQTHANAKRDVDLRKEIALKVHKSKQVERRALFLSKVQAPPSPTATITPKTPPDSPSIFHYSLPSPGLVSPLALFETLQDRGNDVPKTWVEQVDFRVIAEQSKYPPKPRGLPSLDQISARLAPRSTSASIHETPCTAREERARPSVGVGRLRMPLRLPPTETNIIHAPHAMPPKSPLLHSLPELSVTTLVVPRTEFRNSAQLTETNLTFFNSRDQHAFNMLSTLKRRMSPSERHRPLEEQEREHDKYRWKRRSAPADLTPLQARNGFEHPILKLPGGF